MCKRIGITFLLLSFYTILGFAQNNSLTEVKVTSLSAHKIKLDFIFADKVQYIPTSFISQKPLALVLDFNQVDLQIAKTLRKQKIASSFLNSYSLVVDGSRVRVILDLKSQISYADTLTANNKKPGNVYTLILMKKTALADKKISINFQNIDKKAVLQQLADFMDINMVISEQVKGTITLCLHDLPWDEALATILTTQGLYQRKVGKVLFIDTKSNMNKIQLEKLKRQQVTQKLEPVRSILLHINYAKATDIAILIKDKQNLLLSKQGKITVDIRTNTLWIQDTRRKIRKNTILN